MLFFSFFTKLDQMSRVGSRGRHRKCRPKIKPIPLAGREGFYVIKLQGYKSSLDGFTASGTKDLEVVSKINQLLASLIHEEILKVYQ